MLLESDCFGPCDILAVILVVILGSGARQISLLHFLALPKTSHHLRHSCVDVGATSTFQEHEVNLRMVVRLTQALVVMNQRVPDVWLGHHAS